MFSLMLTGRSGGKVRAIIVVVVATMSMLCASAFAIPLELFDQKLEVRCGEEGQCARALRSRSTLGAYTGVSVRGEGRSSGEIQVKDGGLKVTAKGSSIHGVYLSWDNDTYPEMLSSAGLGCTDLSVDGASAIVLKNFQVRGTCGSPDIEGACSITIETRVYDSADPTGQMYAASLLRIVSDREQRDLVIPFSNLIRKGPRGAGRLACAGAVSIFVRTSGYSRIECEIGSIYTNSTEPLVARSVRTPLVTPTSASALAEAHEAPRKSTPTPVAKTVAVPDGTAIPTLDAPARSNLEKKPVETPASASAQNATSSVVTGRRTARDAFPEVGPEKLPVPKRSNPVSHQDEAVYGEVIRQ